MQPPPLQDLHFWKDLSQLTPGCFNGQPKPELTRLVMDTNNTQPGQVSQSEVRTRGPAAAGQWQRQAVPTG